jgi:hypothetical protein
VVERAPAADGSAAAEPRAGSADGS